MVPSGLKSENCLGAFVGESGFVPQAARARLSTLSRRVRVVFCDPRVDPIVNEFGQELHVGLVMWPLGRAMEVPVFRVVGFGIMSWFQRRLDAARKPEEREPQNRWKHLAD